MIAEHGLPWHVAQLGCRAEYWFRPTPPRNGSEAAAAIDPELDRYMHLAALNRGILMTPFHNMALVSPATTESDIDLHTEVFRRIRGGSRRLRLARDRILGAAHVQFRAPRVRESGTAMRRNIPRNQLEPCGVPLFEGAGHEQTSSCHRHPARPRADLLSIVFPGLSFGSESLWGLVRSADLIVVGRLETIVWTPAPADPDSSYSSREILVIHVIDTWKGPSMRELLLDFPSGAASAYPIGEVVVVFAERGETIVDRLRENLEYTVNLPEPTAEDDEDVEEIGRSREDRADALAEAGRSLREMEVRAPGKWFGMGVPNEYCSPAEDDREELGAPDSESCRAGSGRPGGRRRSPRLAR